MRLWPKRRRHDRLAALPEPFARFIPGSDAALRFHEGLMLGTRDIDECTLDLGMFCRDAAGRTVWIPSPYQEAEMGKYVAKLGDDAYVEWSTVVDAPVSWVATREKAVEQWTEERVARADRNGTSIIDGYPAGRTPEEIVQCNRAGPGESEIGVQEIIAAFDEDHPADWTCSR